jgi:hypothetical protein
LVLLDCKVISIFYIFKNERKSENDEKMREKNDRNQEGKSNERKKEEDINR